MKKRKPQYGTSLVEYMLILALITGACIVSTAALGVNLGKLFNGMSQAVNTAMNP